MVRLSCLYFFLFFKRTVLFVCTLETFTVTAVGKSKKKNLTVLSRVSFDELLWFLFIIRIFLPSFAIFLLIFILSYIFIGCRELFKM